MSKIHRLLTKVQADTKASPLTIGFKQNDPLQSRTKFAQEAALALQISADTQDGTKNFLNNGFVIGLTVIFCLAFILSLRLSFRILDEVVASRQTLMELAKEDRLQNEKVSSLEQSLTQVSALKEKELAQLKQVHMELGSLNKTVADNQEKVTELVINHNALKASVDDLRTRDRVLFEKFLTMQKQLGGLQAQFDVRSSDPAQREGN